MSCWYYCFMNKNQHQTTIRQKAKTLGQGAELAIREYAKLMTCHVTQASEELTEAGLMYRIT